MSLYPKNQKRWAKGDIVLHMADAKTKRMFMRVTSYTNDGLARTVYVDDTGRDSRKRWVNDIEWLLDPRDFGFTDDDLKAVP